MSSKNSHKLDLKVVLNALDRKDRDFYSKLSDHEKKAYVPLVLMRYMSSLTDQSTMNSYAVIATNDLVNIGFWPLSAYPDLQHQLLCMAGIGGKQYRPWIPPSKKRSSGKINEFILGLFPSMNDDELSIFKSSFDTDSWTEFVMSSGISDKETKDLISAWKKQKD